MMSHTPTRRMSASSLDKAEAAQWLKRMGGAGEGTRTPDPIITNDVLYQLSYTGLVAR